MTDITNATEVEALLKKAIAETDIAAFEFETCGTRTDGDVPLGLINMHRAVGRSQVALARAQIDIALAQISSTAAAERAKERERLIGNILRVHSWLEAARKEGSRIDIGDEEEAVLAAVKALAAFDADNAKEQSK